LFPAYALKQLEPEKKWTHSRQTEKDIQISTEDGTLTKYMAPTDPKKLFGYRVEDARLSKFRQAMSMFQGTHNFHNYTIARSFKEPAAKRYMIDIKVFEQYKN
jgi:tRNA pseudouridine38-40 synthase